MSEAAPEIKVPDLTEFPSEKDRKVEDDFQDLIKESTTNLSEVTPPNQLQLFQLEV